MDAIADLADRYSFGEIRVTHEQNLVLADVLQNDLHALWVRLKALGFATPNIGLLTDIVCCPGGDFCSLANAKSIPIAEAIQRRFDDLDYLHDLGDLELNMSGLHERLRPPPRRQHRHPRRRQERRGVVPDLARRRAGQRRVARQGDRPVVRRRRRAGRRSCASSTSTWNTGTTDERFIDTVRRIGLAPFKERVYAAAH